MGWGLITFLKQWQYIGKNWSQDNFERWLLSYYTWNSGGNRQNQNAGFSWLFLEAFGRKDDFFGRDLPVCKQKGQEVCCGKDLPCVWDVNLNRLAIQ